MEYCVYKFEFEHGVHFGNGSLDEGINTFYADTLFSALFIEALKCGIEVADQFKKSVQNGNIIFSDAFPYVGEELYIPKPFVHIDTQEDKGNSSKKKAYKKLKFIPINELNCFLKGTYDVNKKREINNLGYGDVKVSASIRGEVETKPYRVGTYYFNKGNGLYIIVGTNNNEDKYLVEDLLSDLSYSGIGGKKSSGMGRFNLLFGKKALVDNIKSQLVVGRTSDAIGDKKDTMYMTLSISMAQNVELEESIQQASYILKKRSGFIDSDTYAKEYMRKRDFYMFEAGSIFINRYDGDIYDVSDGGSHPVYRYGKPLFIGMERI